MAGRGDCGGLGYNEHRLVVPRGQDDDPVVPLPNAEFAIIDPAKVRDYLLHDSHPIGQFKAKFFQSLGFRRERWQELEFALRYHALRHEMRRGPESAYGTKYEIEGPITGPSGRSAEILVAWIVRKGENVPRLITAYPTVFRP